MQPATLSQQPDPTPNRMSSREVAELTGKNHSDVMRDTRNMVTSLQKANLHCVCEAASYFGANGQRYDMYELDKPTTICLLTGYDVVARMKVINRWQQLENGGLPQTKAEAYRALAEAAEREELLLLQIAEAQPAVDFFAQVADSKDAIPIASAATVLNIVGVGEIKLFAFLREQRILQASQSAWNVPYREYIERGYFRVIEQKWQDGRGETRISTKTLVLQKGLDYIHKALSAFS